MDEESKCQQCNINEGKELHTCPFESEINDNEEIKCNCCDDCTTDCAMEI